MPFKILVINPGSTSTKIALFIDNKLAVDEKVVHSTEQLKAIPCLWDQLALRQEAVENFLTKNNIDKAELSAVVSRGGLLRPIPGGTYIINEQMLADAEAGVQGTHAANLGCALAKNFADAARVSAFVVDPISVDEFEPLARYSGHPLIERRALSHTLNIHAVGRMAAEKLQVDFSQANFIIAHLGGGFSICALKKGKIVDVNDASSAGPFTPERTGDLPLQQFIKLCFSGQYSQTQMQKLVMGQGGLTAYLNTNSAEAVEKKIQTGDKKAKEVYEAMAYQIAKEIGAMATVINGNVRAIVISGGLANSTMLTSWIEERVTFIAEVLLMPGEFEMEALANGVMRILEGKERAKIY